MNPTVKLMVQRTEEILIALQSTGYFTEDEWVQVDGLLHKGQYVLTNGPPKIRTQTHNLMDGSPLLSFGDDEVDSKVNDVTVDTIEMLDEDSASSGNEQKEVANEEREPSPAPSAEPYARHQAIPDQHNTDHLSRADLHTPEYPNADNSDSNYPWRALNQNIDGPTPARPASETRSIRPSSSASRSNYVPAPALTMGVVMRANKNVKKTHHIKLELEEGDQVKVLKFVSGLVYYGLNLRTKEAGQFTPDDVDELRSASSAPSAAQARNGGLQSTNLYRLDNIETTAAAEWNDQGSSTDQAMSSARLFDSSQSSRSESMSRPISGTENRGAEGGEEKISLSKRELDDYFEQKFSQLVQSRNAAQGSAQGSSQGLQGLQASRFSIPAVGSPKIQTFAKPEIKTPGKKKYVIPQRKVCTEWAVPGMECTEPGCRDLHYWPDREDQDSVKAPGAPESTVSNTPSRNTSSRTLPSNAGRQYCWYFITPGKECRFTAEECGDLHEMPPHDDSNTSARDINISAKDIITSARNMTCYYWATDGESCGFKDGKCKYLHAWGPKVAPKPGSHRKKIMSWSTSRPQDVTPAKVESAEDDAWW